MSSHELLSVRQRYASYAAQARNQTQANLADPQIQLGPITMREAVFARAWNAAPNEYGIQWDWVKIWDDYRRTNPRMLDLSLRYGAALGGLALASPNKNKTYVGLDFIQGMPGEHPLKSKVLPITLMVLKGYAVLIGASVIRVLNPLPGVVDYYGALGFTMFNQPLGMRASCFMQMEL